ncbi:N6-adenine-specific DNA methylase [Candidatus Terasakiella magnetica]|uniref:N6-adenine-specific DNA methylase n=1 Tax=Candidatus Terasakiella magnetica TaxID=1867952 RepID=A0A1C3RDE2_9PROT|nr:RNA methyltransferase [Candidatus Terasakiella magnetica]SCA55234.1 N6-adenine-specific DNA methylase [Candidatus Terasakiella magnetica]
MEKKTDLEIFLVCVPGFEGTLCAELREKGFKKPKIDKGGVTLKGRWEDVWRANLLVRGASKVLVRLGAFRAMHLAQLDKRARKFPWADFLRADVPVRIDVTCKKSRIYHNKAAAQRIERALTEELGCEISSEAELCLKVRIYEDLCTISIDSSGEGLHKRGHKEALNKAPMRETLAALSLMACGYKGNEPVLDPMCGSGTFVIEAAEMATGLNPGRSRNFAFEHLVTFDRVIWEKLKETTLVKQPEAKFYGFDRDAGAITRSQENATRAGLQDICLFDKQAVSKLITPVGPKGLVIINPPYGVRIGEKKKLYPLYAALGKTLKEQFKGWRVGLITNTEGLAKTCELPFKPKPLSFSHGGIRVALYQTDDLD